MRENGERERGEGELDVVLVGTFFFLVVFNKSLKTISLPILFFSQLFFNIFSYLVSLVRYL